VDAKKKIQLYKGNIDEIPSKPELVTNARNTTCAPPRDKTVTLQTAKKLVFQYLEIEILDTPMLLSIISSGSILLPEVVESSEVANIEPHGVFDR